MILSITAATPLTCSAVELTRLASIVLVLMMRSGDTEAADRVERRVIDHEHEGRSAPEPGERERRGPIRIIDAGREQTTIRIATSPTIGVWIMCSVNHHSGPG